MGYLELAPGSVFANRFEIDKTAGSGGMGTVYRATDRYSGGTVALKLLHAGAGGPDEAERFAREAQLLSELRHPGIVAHVAHGQTPDDQRFLAMEWLDGQDLGQHLLRGALSVRDCLCLLDQVAVALAVAHSRGIIHRDLKPTNLFLVGSDVRRIKILDFGIARRVARSQVMTKTGMVVGTPEYMAPEQARGSRNLTPAADLFSLGCILYECLTGQPPFTADHIAAVLMRILFEEPAPVEERRPGVAAALSALLGRLLTKDPAQRLADVAMLRAEIERLGEMPEPALAITMASPRTKAELFADQEQSLFSVVLAAPEEEDIGLGATQLGSALQLGTTDRQALLQALAGLGGTPDFLANGTLVVTVPPLASAQDQAMMAARAALLIKERWPDAGVSMATGRGIVHGRTAVGEVVELAARSLKRESHPAAEKPTTGVRIDPLSAKLLQGRFAQTPHPGGALLLYEEREADASRPLLGQPTPCVGREAELASLEAQLGSSIDESEACAILITAPPGVGKSRLRHEFLRRVAVRPESITMLFARGDVLGAGAPYGILASALHRLCGLTGSEQLAEQQQALRGRVSRHVALADRERVVLFIGELCSIPFSAEGYPMLQAARHDPKIMRDAVRDACLDWLRAESAAHPVLLVLDDLQWGDALTVALIDEALRELNGTTLCVLALARPEVHETFPRLWQGRRLQKIALKPLSKNACARLIAQVLRNNVDPEAAERAIVQSGGNALFLEELIRSLAEGKPEERSETVIAMLQFRIGRLEAGPRRAIRAAAVFGQTFWRSGVGTILGISPAAPELESWLLSLVDVELIQKDTRSRLGNESEYGFRHALVRDAAYDLLTDRDKLVGHRLAGEFLEATGEHDSITIAGHFERGGDPERAVNHFIIAADWAALNKDLDNVLRWTERGIACGAAGEALGTLRALQSIAHTWQDDWEQGNTCGSEALALLSPGSFRWCKLMSTMFVVTSGTQRFQRFGELVAEFGKVQPSAGARVAYLEAAAWIGIMFSGIGQREPARAFAGLIQHISASLDPNDASSWLQVRMCQGINARMLEPDPWASRLAFQEAVVCAERAGDLRNQAFLSPLLGASQAELGDFALGEKTIRAALESAHRIGESLVLCQIEVYLSALLLKKPGGGDPTEAIALAREVIDFKQVNPFVLGQAHDALAWGLLQSGELRAAEEAARTAGQLFAVSPTLRCHALTGLIQILLRQGRLAEAQEAADQGLQVLTALDGCGYAEIGFRLAVAEARHAAGALDAARDAIRDTLHQIELRANKIPAPSVRERFLTQVPDNARARELAQKWLPAGHT